MIQYQYQLLRYMPDQFAGEFANVGIVFLHLKKTTSLVRLYIGMRGYLIFSEIRMVNS